MRKKILLVPLVLLLIASLVACAAPAPEPIPGPAGPAGPAGTPGAPGAPGAPAPELETFTLKMAFASPSNTNDDIYVFRPFAEYIERITQGRVKTELYLDAVIANWGEQYFAIRDGLCDVGFFYLPAYPGLFPLARIWETPGYSPNQSVAGHILEDFERKYPQWEEQFEGVVPIWSANQLRQDLFAADPLRGPEDFAGKIIGAQSPAIIKVLEMYGASGSELHGADAYLAGKTGLIDGCIAGIEAAKHANLPEVFPYHIRLGFTAGIAVWAFNPDAFAKFTPLEQMLLRQYKLEGSYSGMRGNAYAQQELFDSIPADHHIQWEAEVMEKMKSTFVPMWDEWVEDMEALGYPGKEMLRDLLYWKETYTHA